MCNSILLYSFQCCSAAQQSWDLTWYRSLVPWAWSMWLDLWVSRSVRPSHCCEMMFSSVWTSSRSFESWAGSVWDRMPSADCASWSNCGRRVSNSRSMNWRTEEIDQTVWKSCHHIWVFCHIYLDLLFLCVEHVGINAQRSQHAHHQLLLP